MILSPRALKNFQNSVTFLNFGFVPFHYNVKTNKFVSIRSIAFRTANLLNIFLHFGKVFYLIFHLHHSHNQKNVDCVEKFWLFIFLIATLWTLGETFSKWFYQEEVLSSWNKILYLDAQSMQGEYINFLIASLSVQSRRCRIRNQLDIKVVECYFWRCNIPAITTFMYNTYL